MRGEAGQGVGRLLLLLHLPGPGLLSSRAGAQSSHVFMSAQSQAQPRGRDQRCGEGGQGQPGPEQPLQISPAQLGGDHHHHCPLLHNRYSPGHLYSSYQKDHPSQSNDWQHNIISC